VHEIGPVCSENERPTRLNNKKANEVKRFEIRNMEVFEEQCHRTPERCQVQIMAKVVEGTSLRRGGHVIR
jgi:hypothetical protein